MDKFSQKLTLSVRFPSGEIEVHKHHISVVRGLISAHKNIRAENILFFKDGSLVNYNTIKTNCALDIAFKVSDIYIVATKSLENEIIKLGFEPLIPAQSIVQSRNQSVHRGDIRFFNESHIFHKKEDVKKKFDQKAKPFYKEFENFKTERISSLSTILDTIESKTVVISCFNEPYIELLENFVASCEYHDINIREFFIAFPMDAKSARACDRLSLNHLFRRYVNGQFPLRSHQRGELQ